MDNLYLSSCQLSLSIITHIMSVSQPLNHMSVSRMFFPNLPLKVWFFMEWLDTCHLLPSSFIPVFIGFLHDNFKPQLVGNFAILLHICFFLIIYSHPRFFPFYMYFMNWSVLRFFHVHRAYVTRRTTTITVSWIIGIWKAWHDLIQFIWFIILSKHCLFSLRFT